MYALSQCNMKAYYVLQKYDQNWANEEKMQWVSKNDTEKKQVVCKENWRQNNKHKKMKRKIFSDKNKRKQKIKKTTIIINILVYFYLR